MRAKPSQNLLFGFPQLPLKTVWIERLLRFEMTLVAKNNLSSSYVYLFMFRVPTVITLPVLPMVFGIHGATA